jgi:hypothetical protein
MAQLTQWVCPDRIDSFLAHAMPVLLCADMWPLNLVLCFSHVQVADVLKLVVENCPAASNINTLCSLLQVSRAVQQAVQQAVGHCSLVVPQPEWSEGVCFGIAELASCCSWLPKHAGLIRELTFTAGMAQFEDKGTTAVAHQMISAALQLCAARAQTKAAPPLQLQGLTMQWDVLHPSIAEPLSVCAGLTSLDLFFSDRKPGLCAALYAAIGRLQGLKQLRFRQAGFSTLDSSFTDAISQLTSLQRLELGSKHTGLRLQPSAVKALPASLQGLTFMIRHGHDLQDSEPVPAKGLDLQHLVNLQELGLRCASVQPQAYLALAGLDPVVDLAGLQQLRSLYLADGLALVPVVERLSSLQTLQKLEIGLGAAQNYFNGTVEVLRACLAGVAAATQLTQLLLVGSGSVYDDLPASLNSVHLHGCLSQLIQLQDLCISCMKLNPCDAVLLTGLKSLTALHMHNVRSLDDATAAAVACRLPNLRAFDLFNCGVGTPVLLLVGLATGLESLVVRSTRSTVVLDAAAMGCLTGLTRLTSLTGPLVRSSVEEYRAFRAAMPALVDAPKEPAV